ncbi:MAG: CaiB/BaiF CoA transferase family protein [Devosia sp.]
MSPAADQKLLEGLVVVDFSQFLAGPLASLKLADFGARVIKIERPGGGDLGRSLYLSDLDINGTNTLFHAINRNKESYAANLKSPEELARVKALVARADVVIQNFRPGVIAQYGLDYSGVKAINPRVVYASISGYGDEGEWVELPGQDLLAQARSGLMWLSGSAGDPPVPMGLAIADQLAANITVQGILAGLVRRAASGAGTHVQTSLIEALLDFQFEVLTTHFNDPQRRLPERSAVNNAHAYLAAPYGVYRTADGFLAVAMTPVPKLAEVLGCAALRAHGDARKWFTERDAIKATLAEFLAKGTTAHWLSLLVPADIWAAEVLDWHRLLGSAGFRALDFVQQLKLGNGETIQTTRSPLRFDGKPLRSERPAPTIGEHNAVIDNDFAIGR